MRILFVGDIVGKAGRRLACRLLPGLIGREQVDLTVVNAENAAGGKGVTEEIVDGLLESGADVLTGGNHSWGRREGVELLDREPRLLRPHNYPASPGSGVLRGETPAGASWAVLNLQGRVFMDPIDCPFRAADALLEELEDVPVRLVDFHAEATSEKMALGWYLDGRVTAVLGTHTHVPTADARILDEGTAFCTDVGMTGSFDSIIGVERESAMQKFLTGRWGRLRPARKDPHLCCVLVDCDPATGRARSITSRILDGEGEPAVWGAPTGGSAAAT